LFHPTAENVLATASGEYTVKLWDLANPESAKSVLTGHGDSVQSMAFNPAGTVLVTTCRDRKLRMFDARAGSEAVRVTDGHSGIKGARVVWMGENNNIATTGFSKMSDRQLSVWETGGLGNIKTITIDQSSGIVMPFWSDNNILFLAGKGDGNIRYYEWESDTLYALAEHKSNEPQRGMCFLPRRALNVFDCEIARAYKITGSYIEPIAFIVPRKADSFQSDIFPPAPSSEPAMSAAEFFSGKTAAPKLVNLENGSTSSSSYSAPSLPTPTPAPTKTASAPTPTPAPVPVSPPSPVTTKASSPVATKAPEPQLAAVTPSRTQSSQSNDTSALEEENTRLASELREAREKIRNLELQVEAIRANARKAAQTLLDE